jgi:hypothetical protein
MKHEFKVAEVTKDKAGIFVQKHHYSPVMPSITKHYLGFFVENELRGILTLGWGTQPRQTIRKMFPGTETRDYYEIGKMCMDDEMPRNSESQMVSAAVKWLKRKKPDVKFLYTMADGIMGKCGFVYQASNFHFGERYWTQVYMMSNGEKFHPRSTLGLRRENAKELGKEMVWWLTPEFMKARDIRKIEGYMFRYIMPLNRKAKKMMKTSSTLDWTLPYPKLEDLAWRDVTDPKDKHFIEQPPFTFEDAIWNKKNIDTISGTDDFDLEELMI